MERKRQEFRQKDFEPVKAKKKRPRFIEKTPTATGEGRGRRTTSIHVVLYAIGIFAVVVGVIAAVTGGPPGLVWSGLGVIVTAAIVGVLAKILDVLEDINEKLGK